jgi:hypothetical protein
MTFRGALTVEEYAEALNELVRIFTTHTPPFILLLDMREFNPLRVNAKMRQEGADIWHKNRDLWLRCALAEARVVVNPIARGMLTAFDWLTNKDKWPCRQFATMPEAEQWLNESYEAHIKKHPRRESASFLAANPPPKRESASFLAANPPKKESAAPKE